MSSLPKLNSVRKTSIVFSPILAEAAEMEASAVLIRMKTTQGGLSDVDAARFLEKVGPNVITGNKQSGRLGGRCLASLFALGSGGRVHQLTSALLATSGGHNALLHGAHAIGENVAG